MRTRLALSVIIFDAAAWIDLFLSVPTGTLLDGGPLTSLRPLINPLLPDLLFILSYPCSHSPTTAVLTGILHKIGRGMELKESSILVQNELSKSVQTKRKKTHRKLHIIKKPYMDFNFFVCPNKFNSIFPKPF